MRIAKTLCFTALPVLLAAGCAAPKVMTRRELVGDLRQACSGPCRVASYIYQKSGQVSSTDANGNSHSERFYNYSVQLCDVAPNGTDQKCAESLVLQNVMNPKR